MDAQRTIIMHIDAVQQTEMQFATDTIEWCKALGYLASWNRTYPRVEIYEDGETDMFAVYYDAEGNRAYTVGAVWHDDHYGFHS